MGPGALSDLLAELPVSSDPRVLVGFDSLDDAGVFALSATQALIQTVDFFTPMVDDPYTFGQIAAANALSDVYAMGGEPLTAMNIACFPSCGDLRLLAEIVRGGMDKVAEAGAAVVGGHTVDDNEPKYGLAVTGLAHPGQLILNAAVREGDVLILTKPLGTGIVSTAIKADMASPRAAAEATECMARLNRDAKNAAVAVGVKGGTDVTGFGLFGHLHEMASASRVTIEVWLERLPLLSEAVAYAQSGLIPGGAYSNREYLGRHVALQAGLAEALVDIAFSPETSGGLVLAIPRQQQEELMEALRSRTVDYALIGRAVAPSGFTVVVKGGE